MNRGMVMGCTLGPIKIVVLVLLPALSSVADSWDRILLESARSGDAEMAREALEHGAIPDYLYYSDYNSRNTPDSPLLEALTHHHFNIFTMMMAYEPDIVRLQRNGNGLLRSALQKAQPDIAIELIKQGGEINEGIFKSIEYSPSALWALLSASSSYNDNNPQKVLEIIPPYIFTNCVRGSRIYPDKELYAVKAIVMGLEYELISMNDFSNLRKIEKSGHSKPTPLLDEFLLSEYPVDFFQTDDPRLKNILLYSAVRAGRLNDAKLFLQNGADPNYAQAGAPILFIALNNKSDAMIQLLLESGAHPLRYANNAASRNAPVLVGKSMHDENYSFLNYLASTNQLGLIEKMEIDLKSGEDDPEFHAVRDVVLRTRKSEDLLRLVLQAGHDPNKQDARGQSPLHYAVMSWQGWNPLPLLMEFGADPDLKNAEGESPGDYCARKKDYTRLQYLYPDGSHQALKAVAPPADSVFTGYWLHQGGGFDQCAIVFQRNSDCYVMNGTGMWFPASWRQTAPDAATILPKDNSTSASAPQKEIPVLYDIDLKTVSFGQTQLKKQSDTHRLDALFSGAEPAGSEHGKQASLRIQETISRYIVNVGNARYPLNLNGVGLTTTAPEELYQPIPVPDEFKWLQLGLPNSRIEAIRSLPMPNNDLTEFPIYLSEAVSLDHLLLQNNQIAEIPPLSGFPKLKRIELSQNKLSRFPVGLERLAELEHIDLSNNPIVDFPPITGLQNLKTLYLNHVELTSIPDPIFTLEGLKKLSLNGNRITTMDRISDLKNLQMLQLMDNRISSLPEHPLELPNLRSLYLNGNPLTEEQVEKFRRLNPKISCSF